LSTRKEGIGYIAAVLTLLSGLWSVLAYKERRSKRLDKILETRRPNVLFIHGYTYVTDVALALLTLLAM
jgi:hypothetical protein